jgi:hypothetical protein
MKKLKFVIIVPLFLIQLGLAFASVISFLAMIFDGHDRLGSLLHGLGYGFASSILMVLLGAWAARD